MVFGLKSYWYSVYQNCRIAYIEFKSEADAQKNLEEKQGTEIDGRSVSLYYTGEKGQQRQERTGKNSTWSGKFMGIEVICFHTSSTS